MTSLVHKKLSQTLKVNSLSDLVRAKVGDEVLLLIDCSGSMGDTMRNGKQRIAGLRDTVKEIKAKRDVKMIAFGVGGAEGGVMEVRDVPDPSGSTPLHTAIDRARTVGAGRVVVISDGCPDSTTAAMEAAKKFGGRIDVVFVGNPGEYGEAFLKELAEATGGTSFDGDLSEPKQLSGSIIGLLGTGSDDDDDDQ